MKCFYTIFFLCLYLPSFGQFPKGNYPNGQKRNVVLKNGNNVYEKNYDENGQLESMGFYKLHVFVHCLGNRDRDNIEYYTKEGKWKYFRNKKLVAKGIYKKDVKIEVWKYWDANGKLSTSN